MSVSQSSWEKPRAQYSLNLLPLVCQVQSLTQKEAAVTLLSSNVTVVQLFLLTCDLYDHRGSSGVSSPP